MTRLVLIALLLALALFAAADAKAGDVIVNGAISLNPEEIRDVFLGEKQLAGGLRLLPIDNSVIQAEFLARMLQTDAQKYHARWTRKSFREGLTAPPLKGSDAEVVSFVRATPGAIGYVSKAPPGVTILQRF